MVAWQEKRSRNRKSGRRGKAESSKGGGGGSGQAAATYSRLLKDRNGQVGVMWKRLIKGPLWMEEEEELRCNGISQENTRGLVSVGGLPLLVSLGPSMAKLHSGSSWSSEQVSFPRLSL
jgi:hypothetical protein